MLKRKEIEKYHEWERFVMKDSNKSYSKSYTKKEFKVIKNFIILVIIFSIPSINEEIISKYLYIPNQIILNLIYVYLFGCLVKKIINRK